MNGLIQRYSGYYNLNVSVIIIRNTTHGDKNAENMLIHGDNLLALKALEQDFAGKIKCIYIDPPYNTGSAFEHYYDGVEHSIWQKIFTVKNSARHFSDMHDYVLVYAKNIQNWERNLLPRTEKLDSSYSNPDNDSRGAWTTNAIQARNYYSQGSYEIRSPSGQIFLPPKGIYWRISTEKDYIFTTTVNHSPRHALTVTLISPLKKYQICFWAGVNSAKKITV